MVVVTPNLCFDRTLLVERFEAGSIARPHRVQVTAGGKGVNVVRTLRDLGVPARLVGFVAEADADRFLELVRSEGLALGEVRVPGAMRTATIVLERDLRATVLNEPGPVTGEADADRLCETVERLLVAPARPPSLVATGSLPPGLPVDVYGRLVELARGHRVPSIVDAAREALVATLPCGPDLVTPNLHEAEGIVLGRSDESSDDDGGVDGVRERAAAMGAALVERGARRAVVTAGSYGATYTDASTSAWVEAPRVDVSNPIGAGDALVGGLVSGLARGGWDATDPAVWLGALHWAVAVASAAVESQGAGRVDADRARELAGAVSEHVS